MPETGYFSPTCKTMKTHPSSLDRRGFTLIELLIVITIIAILAGLSIGGYGYVTRKQSESQATIQISLLSKALEEYKLDNGAYPPSSNSNELYKVLYYNGTLNPPTGKIYLAELDPSTKNQSWIDGTAANVKIMDPWGNEYIYRRGDDPNASNPDFDLLSRGKDGASNMTNPAAPENRDDINNF
jgi:type II secretion system protein G